MKSVFKRTKSFKVGLLRSPQKYFICFNESPLNVLENAFYFILKALFVLIIFKLLSWLFAHADKTALDIKLIR